MKRIIGVLVLMVCTATAMAAGTDNQLLLDKVSFQVSAKQWVTTQSALLKVRINVTLNNADLVSARASIKGNLKQIAEGEWHIVQFNRQQDSSGLEKLSVQAQVRVAESKLTDIYKNAQAVSKPGAKYTIDSIDFTPSLDETQKVASEIRAALYQKINAEITRLNIVYPDQHYSVSKVVFVQGGPIAMQRTFSKNEINAMALTAAPTASPLSVSDAMELTALVDVASNRNEGN